MANKPSLHKTSAKKLANQRAKEKTPPVKFDDSAYKDLLFSATFDYSELSFSRAAELLGGRTQKYLTGASFGIVAMILLILIINQNNVVPAVIGVVVFVIISGLSNNWHKVQLAYARKTTLALHGVATERRHVVVCEDMIYTDDEFGNKANYSLSGLRCVHATSEVVVVGFSDKRYVFVPRHALSEQRFRDLVQFLDKKCG